MFLGLTQTAIAGVGISLFIVLLVIGAVVIFKTGVISCGRKTATRKLTNEVIVSEQSEPLHNADAVKMDTVV